jgi:hypothetical protein
MLDKPIRVSKLDPSFKLEVISHEAACDIGMNINSLPPLRLVTDRELIMDGVEVAF